MSKVGLVLLFVGLASFVGLLKYDTHQFQADMVEFRVKDATQAERVEFLDKVTTRISGRDGLCLEVMFDGDNGDLVILSQCITTSLEPRQQWTIAPDGTIQSMGKCMNASSNIVTIYDCELLPLDSIKWELRNDGSIRNPQSGLVLTTIRSRLMNTTFLAMKNDVAGVGQAWRVGNQVELLKTYIKVHNMDICMEAGYTDMSVSMTVCKEDNDGQKWALYPDGTIRANGNRNLCVTSNDLFMKFIYLGDCQGDDIKRWLIKSDGAILDLKSQLVMQYNYILGRMNLVQPTRSPYQ